MGLVACVAGVHAISILKANDSELAQMFLYCEYGPAKYIGRSPTEDVKVAAKQNTLWKIEVFWKTENYQDRDNF